MSIERFTSFLQFQLDHMNETDTHAIIHVISHIDQKTLDLGKVKHDLDENIGRVFQFAQLPCGDHVWFVPHVSMDNASQIAKQLRYGIEETIEQGFELDSAFGVVNFGQKNGGVKDLMLEAKRTAMEADSEREVRVKYCAHSRSPNQEHVENG